NVYDTTIATGHATVTGSETQLTPGMQVMVGEGFVGRTMLTAPAMYHTFDGSSWPQRDISMNRVLDYASSRSSLAPSSRRLTAGGSGHVGRGALCEGTKHALYANMPGNVNTFAGGLVVVARLDKKNSKQCLVSVHGASTDPFST